MLEIRLNRIGMENYNNFGSLMKIIEYRNYNDIDIEFPEYNWVSQHRSFIEFENGDINCPYEPRVFGMGYHGEGEYTAKLNGKVYTIWCAMLKRCYNDSIRSQYLTYEDCYICHEWLNFQNFAEWHYQNYYEIEGEQMSLEKDIIYKNINFYSPETCLYVPSKINRLFVRRNSIIRDLPIGVQKHGIKFVVRCNGTDNNTLFDSVEEAFYVYKESKESMIKKVADEYKDRIPCKLYNAMYNYVVDIND